MDISADGQVRDFRFIIPFFVQFGLYISPVGFTSAVVPQQWRLVYSLNPMTGVIDGFRWAIVGGTAYWPGFALSVAIVGLVLLTGRLAFPKDRTNVCRRHLRLFHPVSIRRLLTATGCRGRANRISR